MCTDHPVFSGFLFIQRLNGSEIYSRLANHLRKSKPVHNLYPEQVWYYRSSSGVFRIELRDGLYGTWVLYPAENGEMVTMTFFSQDRSIEYRDLYLVSTPLSFASRLLIKLRFGFNASLNDVIIARGKVLQKQIEAALDTPVPTMRTRTGVV